MEQSSRLLNLEFNHGLMSIEYKNLLHRIKRVERIMNINAMKKEVDEMKNKEISGTTEDIKYS